MFLRCKKRRKDGKEHHYWSIVENRRVVGGRILQRHVLYLCELNGSQEASWRRTVELFGQDPSAPQQASLFPETHLPATHDSAIPNIGIRISEIEQAFKELKGDLAIHPIHHQLEERIEAHNFISFMAYCLQVTLKARLKRSASGLTPRSVLEKFAAVQMLDVHLPTTDGREVGLITTRSASSGAKERSPLRRLPSNPRTRPARSRPASRRHHQASHRLPAAPCAQQRKGQPRLHLRHPDRLKRDS